MKRRELPDTDINIIMGHGDFTIKEMRALDRRRHRMERILPPLRRQNREYYENTEREFPIMIDEKVARVQRKIRSLGQYDKAIGMQLQLSVPGSECSERFPGFRFSDIEAKLDVRAARLEMTPQASWLFHIVNRYNVTNNLLVVDTDFELDNDQVTNMSTVDTETGKIYSSGDYDLEGRANLAASVHSIFNHVEFELLSSVLKPDNQ